MTDVITPQAAPPAPSGPNPAAAPADTDASAAELVAGAFGGGKTARAGALIGVVGHLNEHYGNLVTYMRIKGIVPPTSRR